ncbi:MAG: polysaccharide deacetylase family protein [Candidatus Wallbacteria bacterium]|nr:polysaccharide deacetylase family protein [Candidatus Wallbacteria bacterium]
MKPTATLSLDLDNLWCYLKVHGDPEWQKLPSYLESAVPRLLRFFAERELRPTVFVVGHDCQVDANRKALAELGSSGLEIANHSFHHEPWLHLMTPGEIEEEIATAEAGIENATGVRPRAFRGPGYSLSEATLGVLVKRGYLYDASILPSFLGPLARAYYFFHSQLGAADRRRRSGLFGDVRQGLLPLRPFRWEVPGGSLLELPITTLPLLRIPFHISYLLYLSTISPAAARAYFRLALRTCDAAGLGPSLLLHPLDLLGGDELRGLEFFPGMQLSSAQKLERVSGYLAEYCERYAVRPLGELAAELSVPDAKLQCLPFDR